MDHVVYTDSKSQELENLLNGEKTIIIRGATGENYHMEEFMRGDCLYLINNNGEGLVKAKCTVKSVFNSDKMNEAESIELVDKNIEKLCLSDLQYKKWAGKRYLVLIEVKEVKQIKPFEIDKSGYGNMDDWLPVENVKSVKK